MSEKDINNLKEMLVDFNEYSTDYTKSRCRELEGTIKNTLNEIERLNNSINKGIEAINVYQNEKTLSVGYQDLKRIRGILQGNEFDLQMFEEYLKELGEKNENE